MVERPTRNRERSGGDQLKIINGKSKNGGQQARSTLTCIGPRPATQEKIWRTLGGRPGTGLDLRPGDLAFWVEITR